MYMVMCGDYLAVHTVIRPPVVLMRPCSSSRPSVA